MFSTFSKVSLGKVLSYSPEYVYSVDRLSTSKLISSLSDRSIKIFDLNSGSSVVELLTIKHTHDGNVEGVQIVDENSALTAGSDGVVKLWDFRTNKSTALFSKDDSDQPLLSLAYSSLTNEIAAGTELVAPDAGVIVWDIRKPNTHLRAYLDSHSDDVTSVAFHSSIRNLLLSGSTDGLVVKYDTTISDEDDAVMQVVNNGASIHSAGFLGDNMYALSHMETFSIYRPTNKHDETEEEDINNQPILFGDIREPWDCEYVVGVGKGYIAIGSNSSEKLSLIALRGETVSVKERIVLPGAHGEEVARAVLVDERNARIFSGGEDGKLKVWIADGNDHQQHWSEVKPDRKKKVKDKRFRPY
ncbi:WD40-repeat-containing domain protein [Lipomyces japonicus]|uniref:WD40-repeat-containing domain protein n=1 Tax=Lipomyces japonicus TaxID=56871 RepID=UPI0034CE65A9